MIKEFNKIMPLKYLPLLVLTIICSVIYSIGQELNSETSQKSASDRIVELNKKVFVKFNNKDYKGALELAQESYQTAVASGLDKKIAGLISVMNLGEIYLVTEKHSEAIEFFEKGVLICENSDGANKNQLETVLKRLAVAYFRKKDTKKSIGTLMRLKEFTENKYGNESPQTVKILVQIADAKSKLKEYSGASDFYLQAIAINDKILTKEEKEKRDDLEKYQCFVYHKGYNLKKMDTVIKEYEQFNKTRQLLPNQLTNAGIVNGKAIDLVKPTYPQKAKDYRAEGFVIVQVTINEQGFVEKAKASCGILEFVNETEAAARASRFTPTYQNGIAVKVTGQIVYKFTAR